MTFGSPTTRSCSYTCLDTGFVKENNLIRRPLCNPSNSSISEYRIPLCCFFCNLILADDSSILVEIYFFMCNTKFFENNAKPSKTDYNIVLIINFC